MARTVLLADDSVTAQNMGRRILMDAGYEVVTVNNGSAALKKIHESHPDLIVLDVYMPGYGGLEVCQRLKESVETARIPVLLSVGKMEPFKADEAKRVRADGHIVKPFEASELLAALTRLEDRIVPQADSSNGRRGKSDGGKFESARSERKSHLSKVGDPLASAEEPQTDRVAYLAEAKKRRVHTEEVNEEVEAPARQEVATASSEHAVPAADFVVQPSAAPPESYEESPNAEVEAAETPVEVASIFDAPTIEVPASESALEETAFDKTPFEKSEPRAAVPEARYEQAAPEEAPMVAADSSRVSAARWIAENVALSVEEASIALEAEMQQAQAASAVAAHGATIPAPDPVASSAEVGVQTEPEAETRAETEAVDSSGAAFAAAAGAISQHPAVSAQSTSPVAEDVPSVREVGPEPPSDATAAWANWQQIRDSVMSPQKAAELAESMAAIAQADLPTPEPPAKEDLSSKPDSAPTENVSPAPADERPPQDDSINDIVDSVLADLKPRLMQEIAKKLAAKK